MKIFDINHNEGGRGLIYSIRFDPLFVYVCFWTKWIAPRVVIDPGKIDISFDP